jgi:hypothetical protein
MEQKNLHLEDKQLLTILKQSLPLKHNMNLNYHDRSSEALRSFVQVLYDYLRKLPHKSKEGNYFLINEI